MPPGSAFGAQVVGGKSALKGLCNGQCRCRRLHILKYNCKISKLITVVKSLLFSTVGQAEVPVAALDCRAGGWMLYAWKFPSSLLGTLNPLVTSSADKEVAIFFFFII